MILIGAWKNFTDLEESLSLDELFEIYGSILEKESEKFKRDASLQGVNIPDESEEDEPEEEDFRTRLARHKSEQTGNTKALAEAKFGEGQGYMVIGG